MITFTKPAAPPLPGTEPAAPAAGTTPWRSRRARGMTADDLRGALADVPDWAVLRIPLPDFFLDGSSWDADVAEAGYGRGVLVLEPAGELFPGLSWDRMSVGELRTAAADVPGWAAVVIPVEQADTVIDAGLATTEYRRGVLRLVTTTEAEGQA